MQHHCTTACWHLWHHSLNLWSILSWVAGIEGEVVRAVAASRYFSMLATASGEIWSFGGGFNGELGFRHSSWVTSAHKVEGELAKVGSKSTTAMQCLYTHTCTPLIEFNVTCLMVTLLCAMTHPTNYSA